jgi:hypothetical protein
MALRNWDRNESAVTVFGRNFKPVTERAATFYLKKILEI